MLSKSFSTKFQQQNKAEVKIDQVNLETQTFTIKHIVVKNLESCETYDFQKNGSVTQTNCNNIIETRDILSNQTIQRLLTQLTRQDFDNLKETYYSPDINIVITIETNFGTKTITISNNGETPIDEILEDLISDLEEVIEDISDPPISPPPAGSPTPTPFSLPSPTPTPPGSTPIPTPTPSPTPIGATPEPFNCSMLDQQGVTVSNIRCLEEEPAN